MGHTKSLGTCTKAKLMNYENIRRIHAKGIGNIFNKITEANLSNMREGALPTQNQEAHRTPSRTRKGHS